MSDQLNSLLDEGIDAGIDWSSEDLEDYDVHKNRSSLLLTSGEEADQELLVPMYPKEKGKTFLAFGFLVLGFVLNSISIALVHDRVPDRNIYPPLPDAILDNIHIMPELMKVPDVFVIITIILSIGIVAIHRHRWIVARRIFFILSVLYLMRSVTMYVTVLPLANYTIYCSPKANATSPAIVFERVFELLGGGGMQISGQKRTCGDYIYSGHTIMLMVGYSLIQEYSPKGLSLLPWISFVLSWSGMAILLIARGHYTIDVLIGYYAATRMFWTYHSLTNNEDMKIKSSKNFHANVWWFPIFQYLEGKVKAPLPRQYSLPWVFETKPRHSFQFRFREAIRKDNTHSLSFTCRQV